MNDLDIKIHENQVISIKDLSHDLDISESKWNFIFAYLLKEIEVIYFRGHRSQFIDDDFYETINYLSEEILVDKGYDHFSLLFRLKPTNLVFNRTLLSKLWTYYEYPALIFLKDKAEEQNLSTSVESDGYYDDYISLVDGICIVYQSFELNVLWIKGD